MEDPPKSANTFTVPVARAAPCLRAVCILPMNTGSRWGGLISSDGQYMAWGSSTRFCVGVNRWVGRVRGLNSFLLLQFGSPLFLTRLNKFSSRPHIIFDIPPPYHLGPCYVYTPPAAAAAAAAAAASASASAADAAAAAAALILLLLMMLLLPLTVRLLMLLCCCCALLPPPFLLQPLPLP